MSTLHHEGHEEHEGRKTFFNLNAGNYPVFVAFVIFVVRISFVKGSHNQ